MSRGLPRDRDIEYHGNKDVWIHDPGVLDTDHTGLSKSTCIFMAPREKWTRFDKIFDAHPEFRFLGMSHRTISFEGPYAVATCEYGGFDTATYGDFTPPIYEMSVSTAEEPIETHKDFSTSIAGTPTSPLNSSVWKRVTDNAISTITTPTSNNGWVFHGFQIGTELYGLERYLDVRVTWKETVNYRRSLGGAVRAGGTIETPRGPAPSLGGLRNWLNAGTTTTIQGAAEQVVTEWWGSGPKGWNTLLY